MRVLLILLVAAISQAQTPPPDLFDSSLQTIALYKKSYLTTIAAQQTQVTSLQKQVFDLTNQLAAANNQVADLTAQLDAKSSCMVIPADWVPSLTDMLAELTAINLDLWEPGGSRLLFLGVLPKSEFDQVTPASQTILAAQ